KKRQDKGDHWTNLRNCAYIQEFEKEKVIYPETTQGANFFYDPDGVFFAEKTNFIMVGKNLKYLTGILSSKLVTFVYKNYYAGVDLSNSGYQYNKHAIENLPIPQITSINQSLVSQIESLVDQILSLKKQNKDADTSTFEREIDHLVYQLYHLAPEEIAIVEKK
ncbi:MAG: class I SAM-dependent DNA methyltransferase, partial [Candidatus Moranbacteria bacterium]|nr:class I SAM-dependent DNA methyltransferase [Candidatus Moranbacteria bacterium]